MNTDFKNAPRRTNHSPIAQIRINRGLTQAQLAEKTGYYQKDISRWERGEHIPGVPVLRRLAQALKCSLEDLLQDPPGQ